MDESGMETSAEGGDDQGSGWLQVKKKHRNGSKFCAQSCVGGSSTKTVSAEISSFHDKHDTRLPKSGKKDSVPVRGSVASQSSLSKNEKVEHYLDKCVVNEGNAPVKDPSPKTITITNADVSSMSNKDIYQKDQNAIHRIKWGDLEDDSIELPLGSAAASGIKFGKIGDDDLAICVKSCDSSCDPSEVDKDVVEVIDAACGKQEETTSSLLDSPLKESNDASSVVSLYGNETASVDSKLVDRAYDSPDCMESPSKGLRSKSYFNCACKQSGAEHSCTINEEAASKKANDLADIDSSEKRNTARDLSTLVDVEDLEVTSSEMSELKSSRESNVTTKIEDSVAIDKDFGQASVIIPNEDHGDLCNKFQSNLSKGQIMNVLGERETGESKERFRERLWCFLFENLNRAVDELYLLCELECDLEQVKEAILVLEESASDFRDLSCRVQEFEELKKSSSQSKEGTLMTIKSDYRRPHALSWEVRRMTTSPHRAEILSSSLEAFKKIQEERAKTPAVGDLKSTGTNRHSRKSMTVNVQRKSIVVDDEESENKSRKQGSISDLAQINLYRERKGTESARSSKIGLLQNIRLPSLSSSSTSDVNLTKLPPRGSSAVSVSSKSKREPVGSVVGLEKDTNSTDERQRKMAVNEKEDRERRTSLSWKSMNAWKEKRNWEEILASPCRVPSRISHSPGISRKSAERARILHDKLMSPEKKKKNALDLKKDAEEKHARAMRIRNELENERVQKLQRTSEKLNRVNEWQAVRSMKLRECMYARHQRSESRHEAYIAQVVKRAGDESIKVNELRFITSLNEENKKFMLRQKLHDSEMRRAEKLQVLKTKQKEDIAREEAVLERRKLIEAEKLQRLAEIQRRKEEAQVRREEERKASSAAREAKAIEQVRRREERVKAQQEEAELLAQKLAEKLSESEQRRKFYLEQIRERASMDFRDQSSPLLRRSLCKEGQGKSTSSSGGEDNQVNSASGSGDSHLDSRSLGVQHSLKRRIKKIRQRLMALKHEVPEPMTAENSGIGYRTALTTARAKIGRWLQDLQRHRQERKQGASSIGLITAEMVKFLDGKELELQASRQAGVLDFISSALPASHISKPEACQVTIYLLRLLKVLLSVPTNRSYFLSQNLLPPLIPMLSAALENYIKIAASLNGPSISNLPTSRASPENFNIISDLLDDFLWNISMIIGHEASDERQVQMHDCLLELVVSYQIIHRLRDLFALYDRPQTEGSPFPSSILLSINFLVALTSKPQSVSIIDWNSVLVEATAQNEAVMRSVDVNSTCLHIQDLMKEFEPPFVPKDDLVVSSDASPSLQSVDVNSTCLHIQDLMKEFEPPFVPKDDLVVSSDASPSLQSCETLKNGIAGLDCENEQSNYSIQVCGNHLDAKDICVSNKNLSSGVQKSVAPHKDEKSIDIGAERKDVTSIGLKQPHKYLLSAISETGLVSLPSLLTAVLLQANNRLSSEQGSYVLPSNFEEVATGVLKVMNNLALMDLAFVQRMLARPDLKIEFFHIMSFLLTHCTSNWKVASDQVGLLLLQSLFLLGHFSLFHPGNQAVLRWGKGSTILHKVCDLPFVFFSDPALMPILAGTLVAACYGCEQNKGVVQQELSTEMLLSLVKSCSGILPASRSSLPPESTECNRDGTLLTSESRKGVGELGIRTTRLTARSSRIKGGGLGHRGKNSKHHNQDSKINRTFEEASIKQKTYPEATSALTLHARFPRTFLEKVEQFFAAELTV